MKVAQTEPAESTSTAELRMTAVALERRLASEIRTYEERYEIRSTDLEQALRSGTIRETAEIVDWVISYRTLLGLADELQARAQ